MYPISFEADPEPEGRNRLTSLVRCVVVIPWALVAFLWLLAAALLAVAAWLAILATGRYPQGLYDFNVKTVRLLARVGGFANLLTDRFPRFDGDRDDATRSASTRRRRSPSTAGCWRACGSSSGSPWCCSATSTA